MLQRWRSGFAGIGGDLRLAVVGDLCEGAGRWTYLYRAVDKHGRTIDFYLSARRNAKAAKRFLGKALRGLKSWQKPHTLNTDQASAYTVAIAELKEQGRCPDDIQHRQVKYLNNVIECDHGKLKRIINPMCFATITLYLDPYPLKVNDPQLIIGRSWVSL